MKNTFVFPKFSLVTFIVGIVSLTLHAVIKVLEKMDTHLYFSGVNRDILYYSILCAGCALVLISIIVFLFKNIKHKWLSVIISLSLALTVVFFLNLARFWMSDTKYFEFTSDDNKHSIVVEETSWLLAGGGYIYEKTSNFTMKEVGQYSTDDGYRPFSHNDYYFVWNENNFEIHLKSGEYFQCYEPLEYIK